MNKPLVKLTSKLSKTVKDVNWPEVVAKLEVDSEEYLPLSERNSNFFYLKAKLNKDLIIPSGGMSNIDCGFSIKVPSNYCLVVSTLQNWNEQGLIILNQYVDFDQRIVVAVKNISEINNIIIKNLETFAKLVIEPSYPI